MCVCVFVCVCVAVDRPGPEYSGTPGSGPAGICGSVCARRGLDHAVYSIQGLRGEPNIAGGIDGGTRRKNRRGCIDHADTSMVRTSWQRGSAGLSEAALIVSFVVATATAGRCAGHSEGGCGQRSCPECCHQQLPA